MKYIILILLQLSSLLTYAYQFSFNGKADDKYPIVIEVDRNPNGSITGRYAYQSTLRNQGRDNRASWLYIQPVGNSKSDYVVTDSKGNIQEQWSDATFWRDNGINYFSVDVTNAKGKTFKITAKSVTSSSASNSNNSSASLRYKKKLEEVSVAPIHVMRADGKKIWYNRYTTLYGDSGYDNKMYIYDSQTDRETVLDLNKTSIEYMQVDDMVEHDGIITIIMTENTNSNGWVIGTYVWQYNCYNNTWKPLATKCSGAKFVNNRKAVQISTADCINPEDPTYLQEYKKSYRTIQL